MTAIFKRHSVPNDEDDESADDSNEDSDGEDSEDEDVSPLNPEMKGSEHCTFDLRNMLAVNSHQIAATSLYKSKKSSSSNELITIPLDNGHGLNLDEDFLLSQATKGCTQLVHALWQLPTERSDAGPLVHLPTYDEIKLPRALVSFTLVQFPFFCVPFPTNALWFLWSAASSATKGRDEMGKVCKSKGNSPQ